ncbi:MAG TPA: hypothetical protein ENF18_00935 [candidate division WOR-3 bacterium]|uniref:Nucleotide kinase n=1 Tax=candidate division WOR-3 bacterium TaxID=2052148 RepID=A0A7C0ZCB9_UNCW3|nr:hypothetical protein [candidate division WOR-3 bacterium]
MVFIITGGVNTGKTTLFERIHKRQGGGGFSLPKIIVNNQFKGYWIKDLNTGEKTEFALIESMDGYLYKMGRFYFLPQGMEFARRIYKKAIETEEKNFFIDEIGPLELEDKGFSHIFRDALTSFENIYVVVRESCLDDVIREFGLNEYKLVRKDGGI